MDEITVNDLEEWLNFLTSCMYDPDDWERLIQYMMVRTGFSYEKTDEILEAIHAALLEYHPLN